NKIAFCSNRDGNHEIYVMNSDGTGQTNLTNSTEFSEVDPVWSPDGNKIALTRYQNSNTEIYVMDADGTNLVNLTNSGDAEYGHAWSPDGTKIAYIRYTGVNNNNDIYVMNADGTEKTLLISDYDVVNYVVDGGLDWSAGTTVPPKDTPIPVMRGTVENIPLQRLPVTGMPMAMLLVGFALIGVGAFASRIQFE
ncbi:MAG: hypothetical protein Q7K29_02335, partial [Thermoleophilia bacterium]|nr:hypothetical protein [Thermoleophilia bacterium]